MTWSRVKPRSQVHGWDHAKARKAWAARHQPTDPCVRCGHPLGPMGRWLHLDHDDYDKRVYRGFSHGSCNVRAGGQLGRERQQGGGTSRARSRDWVWGTRVKAEPRAKKVKPPMLVPEPKDCLVCGTVFVAKRKYCTNECGYEMNARLARERYRARVGLPPTWERSVKRQG